MLEIATKTKYITTAWDEQQSISEMITYASNNALILFRQLSDAQVAVDPLIEKINTIDLTTSQVTTVEIKVDVQLMKDL
jgi:hypothetical protein